jgi:hypothetical protein
MRCRAGDCEGFVRKLTSGIDDAARDVERLHETMALENTRVWDEQVRAEIDVLKNALEQFRSVAGACTFEDTSR